jgi:thioester reductase-like protein
MSDGVLLTGATGFVGMELLARYLERTDRRVYALVRGTNERDVTARLEHTLLCLFGADHPYTRRVVAVRGDITCPDLGLGGKRRGALRAAAPRPPAMGDLGLREHRG